MDWLHWLWVPVVSSSQLWDGLRSGPFRVRRLNYCFDIGRLMPRPWFKTWIDVHTLVGSPRGSLFFLHSLHCTRQGSSSTALCPACRIPFTKTEVNHHYHHHHHHQHIDFDCQSIARERHLKHRLNSVLKRSNNLELPLTNEKKECIQEHLRSNFTIRCFTAFCIPYWKLLIFSKSWKKVVALDSSSWQRLGQWSSTFFMAKSMGHENSSKKKS